MKISLHIFIFAIALVCFLFAAAVSGPPVEPWRLRIISAGLFCWALSAVVTI